MSELNVANLASEEFHFLVLQNFLQRVHEHKLSSLEIAAIDAESRLIIVDTNAFKLRNRNFELEMGFPSDIKVPDGAHDVL